MAANENRSVQLYRTSPLLTTRERREFKRAERTIARGLKSFLAVGLALKRIRDQRLYRQHYDTFEEYCIRRWDFSRIRAYQICAASEVVADLSTIVDIPLLPENEAQARPLTRLKDPAHWRRAWQTAVKLAAAEKRPVTARDTEDAVQRLNGNGRIEPAGADGEPVFNCVKGTNAALIAAAARLYLRKGNRVADVTFGRGVFWQNLNLANYSFYKSDKMTCPSSPHDFRQLPYKADFFDVVVFDPPYGHGGYTMRTGPCYALASKAGGLPHREIIEGYERGMTEAARVLKPGGTLWVKCADEVEASRQRRSHIEVLQIAQGLELIDQDLFVLMQEAPPVTNGRRQQHARKNCSFLWVFRKPRG